jgi:hypothetical protein
MSDGRVGMSKRFRNSIIVTTLLDTSPAQNKQNFDQIFSEGKQLSDFIGMIVRLAFAIFVYTYLLSLAQKNRWIL